MHVFSLLSLLPGGMRLRYPLLSIVISLPICGKGGDAGSSRFRLPVLPLLPRAAAGDASLKKEAGQVAEGERLEEEKRDTKKPAQVFLAAASAW
jgi:hypothetical protein